MWQYSSVEKDIDGYCEDIGTQLIKMDYQKRRKQDQWKRRTFNTNIMKTRKENRKKLDVDIDNNVI